MDFLRQAAADPQVLAIKQTLYRTGHDSPVVDALVAAAQCRQGRDRHRRAARALRRGGQHRAVQPPAGGRRARHVRRRRLQDARQDDCWSCAARPAASAATATSAPATTTRAPRALYTDYGLFTCDEEIGQDVHELFLQLTSLTQTPKLRPPAAVAVQPARHGARPSIARETEHARAGRPARDHRQDERAGGPADHRGAVPRLVRRREDRADRARRVRAAARRARACRRTSRVRSIVGRFLEHSRVFYFENGGEPELYLRERRLDGAQLLPPRRGGLPDRAARRSASASCAISRLCLADNTKAWELRPDGSYAARRARQRRGRSMRRRSCWSLRGRSRRDALS